MTNSTQIPNRLINEKSPYLLQHAYNPVNWFPWGEEAFEKARHEDKPVFLSIGYSTCHWCHVLSHESFEDPEIASLLNDNFVCIKVDREERPDIDAVYMAVCQALTGSGGWPLSIFMTSEQKPFYAGTYFPKNNRYGHIGMRELLLQLAEMWRNERQELLAAGEEMVGYLRSQEEKAEENGQLDWKLLKSAAEIFQRSFDEQFGGFGHAPKFPMPHNLLFLLRYGNYMQDEELLYLAKYTLIRMYRGGIFDHIGGAFSRYSTDDRWLIPHFEKMLYDNALLAYTCQEAYEQTGNPLFRMITVRTLDYVLAELTDSDGGFYCGQDADSEGEEGKYYSFTPGEIKEVLGVKEGQHFCQSYGIRSAGNFEGKSIPNLIENSDFMLVYEEQKDHCQRLYEYRLHRYQLHKDDKILPSWNGLMIAAMAKAGREAGGERYLTAAKRAWEFVTGKVPGSGQLDDYAFYAFGLLELYQSTYEISCLQECVEMAEQLCNRFLDKENGGFFLYASDSEQLIVRPKEVYDGAIPSGNSVAAYVLGRLARLTGEVRWQEMHGKQMDFLAGRIREYPPGFAFSLLAVQEALMPSKELVCVAAGTQVPVELGMVSDQNMVILLKNEENQRQLQEVAPFTADYQIPESGAQFYLCQNGSCQMPVDGAGLLKLLEQLVK